MQEFDQHHDDPAPAKQPEQGQASDSYKVGYRKPPLKTRFQKGQSGNPRGRAKKKRQLSDRDVRKELMKAMERQVNVNINGKEQKVPIILAIYDRALVEAARGNYRFAKLAVDLRRQLVNEDEDIRARLAEGALLLEKHLKESGEKPDEELAEIIAAAKRRAYGPSDFEH